MDIDIHFRGILRTEDSGELDVLADSIAAISPSLERSRMLVPGVKDGGLTIGLAIAGLTLSALSTLVSALAYWRSTRPQYSMTIRDGEAEYSFNNLSKEDILTLSKKLEVHGPKGSLLVRIFRK